MRSATLTLVTGLIVAQASAAEASFVELTILGEGGAETVEIGPEGGQVPYTLFVETDPLSTPDNLGLASVLITIDTDTGVAQEPLSQFDPPFDSLLSVGRGSLGLAQGDDIVNIRFLNDSSLGGIPPTPIFLGLGQSGPQLLGRGELVIPGASIGTTFQASILLDPGSPDSSRARVWVPVVNMLPGTPDDLFGNRLTISVVPEPSTSLVLVGAVALVAYRRRAIPLFSNRYSHDFKR